MFKSKDRVLKFLRLWVKASKAAFLVFLMTLPFFAYLSSVNAYNVYPNFHYSPLTPRVGDIVTFDCAWWEKDWFEAYGYRNFSYSWVFGDNAIATGVTVSHVFANLGTYKVEVTLIENNVPGLSCEQSIEVRERTPVTVYVSLSSDSVYVGQNVTISGNLIYNDKGVPDALVSLLSKNTYVEYPSWNEIAKVKTDDYGNYSFSWKTPHWGAYEVGASWAGNSTYPETNTSVSLMVLSFGDLITDFSSNSTVTGLVFNMSTYILSFSVEGPSGTVGYAKITLEKDPAFNPQDISVFLDGKPIEYTIDSTEQSWIVGITYTHSIHNVIVYFSSDRVPDTTPGSPSLTTSEPFPMTWLVAAIAIIVVAVATATVYAIRKRKNN